MEARQLSIDDLVERGIPRAELEGDEEYSRETMHKLASIFDVALLVTFVSFSEMAKREESLDLRHFHVPSFSEDHEPEYLYDVITLSNWSGGEALVAKANCTYVVDTATLATGRPDSWRSTRTSRLGTYRKQYVQSIGPLGLVPDVDEENLTATVTRYWSR